MRTNYTFLLLIGLAVLLLITCKKDNGPNLETDYVVYKKGEGTIGAGGGIINVTDSKSPLYNSYISIPQEAINTTTNFTIKKSTSNNTFEDDSTKLIVNLEPSGTIFNSPIDIGIPYNDVNTDSLLVYFFDEPANCWKPVQFKEINRDKKIVIAQTNHFTEYTVAKSNIKFDIFLFKYNNKVYASVRLLSPFTAFSANSTNRPWLKNIHQLIDDNSVLVSVGYVVQLKEQVDFWKDKVLSTKKILYCNSAATDENHNLLWSNLSDPWPSTSSKETYYSGNPLLFRFNDISLDNSKKYYVDVTMYFLNDTYWGSSLGDFGTKGVFISNSDRAKTPSQMTTPPDCDGDGIVDSFDPICGNAPLAPSTPSPNNNTIDIATNLTLTWNCSDPDGDPITFDVYLGKESSPSALVSSAQTSKSFTRSSLDYSTTYYWKIVATDSHNNKTTGSIWKFTTIAPPNTPPNLPSSPSPTNGATGVSTSPTLVWNCSDPDGDALTYDVYFSTSNNPTTVVSTNQAATSLSRSGLINNTIYYWKVVAKDSKNAITNGPVWYFTTITGTSIPSVTTNATTNISSTNATVGGNVTSDGGATVTERGVYWSTASNPVSTGTKLAIGSGTGDYSTALTGLTPNTKYYIVAYAKNSVGEANGNEVNFTTITGTSIPSVTTNATTNISSTNATVGGNVTSDGGATVTERGVYWSTASNPVSTGTKLAIGSGTGDYSTALTGLTPNTKYYIVAYAKNSVGEANGNEVNFTTITGTSIPSVTTNAATNISSTNATVGGNVTSDGGATVTERGVYWGTASNPVSTGTKLAIGSGTGAFSTTLSSLTASTTYYVVAYSINSIGESLGNEVSFTTTIATSVPDITTNAATIITATGATVGGNITSNGGATIIERGIYWGTATNPTNTGIKLAIGSGIGLFSATITSLIPRTTYYVVAYAKNSVGESIGSEISFTTTADGQTGSVSDIDGNNYNTVIIGTQEWFAENLKTTKFADGIDIINITDNTSWTQQTNSAYCWYNSDIANKTTYGALYNWYAVVDNHKLCPSGWHVPNDAEWKTLIDHLGGVDIAGGKLKEVGTIHWYEPNLGATNEKGFTALPGGQRFNVDGGFSDITGNGLWWSSTEMDASYATSQILYYNDSKVYRYYKNMGNGLSVRCVKGEYQSATLPTVETATVSFVSSNEAEIISNVTSDGGAVVLECGVYWGTSSNPVNTGTKLVLTYGGGMFATTLTSLSPSTTYYVVTYAKNRVGEAIGNEVSFTTDIERLPPTVSTSQPTCINYTSAKVRGIVTSNGNSFVSERGIYWGPSPDPINTGTKLKIGLGTGSFSAFLTSLSASTTYYVVAYAINSIGESVGDQYSFITPLEGQTVKISDIDGNEYNPVIIGTQVWMVENLKTTKYSDGTNIPNITDNTSWENQTIGAYCWYSNDINNKTDYGALYNWYTIVDSRNLCPSGWHMPANNEWIALTNYLGGATIAGGKLKEAGTVHWTSPNTGATNESGFSALPGGWRSHNGTFYLNFFEKGTKTFWWTSSVYNNSSPIFQTIRYDSNTIGWSWSGNTNGLSVRCVMD